MEKKICVQCGQVFTITDSEKQFYENRKLHFPKRCIDCRGKNNPNIQKTNTYPRQHKKTKVFIVRKIHVSIAIFLIAFSIFYIKSKISSDNYHLVQEVSITDSYTFKSESLLQEHFNKHGSELEITSASEYESSANEVIHSPKALHKTEVDGDSVYYIETTNELVILSTEGYIRTYFKPEDGIDYYNRQ